MYNTSEAHTSIKNKLCLVLICFLIIFFSDVHTHRVRRRVVFSKNSKLFFRLNGKDNVIPWVQIFAHGWAIRINWDLPDTLHRRHKFFKRDIHSELENVVSTPGFQGYSCILKYICEVVRNISNSKKCGLLCEVARVIKMSQGNDAEFFQSLATNCDYYENLCQVSSNVV